jgi:hypothetical protein
MNWTSRKKLKESPVWSEISTKLFWDANTDNLKKKKKLQNLLQNLQIKMCILLSSHPKREYRKLTFH